MINIYILKRKIVLKTKLKIVTISGRTIENGIETQQENIKLLVMF